MVATLLSSSGLLRRKKAGGQSVYCSAVAKGQKFFFFFFTQYVYSGIASSLSPRYPALLTHRRQIFLMGPPTPSPTHALYHNFRGLSSGSLSHHSCQTREDSWVRITDTMSECTPLSPSLSPNFHLRGQFWFYYNMSFPVVFLALSSISGS